MRWSCGHSGYIKADWLQKNKYPIPGAGTAESPEPSVAVSLLMQSTRVRLNCAGKSPKSG